MTSDATCEVTHSNLPGLRRRDMLRATCMECGMASRWTFCASIPIAVIAVVAAISMTLTAPATVQAAEVTDVLDAFDKDNPYDLSLRLRFGQDSRSAFIAREVRCLKDDLVGSKTCPGGSATLLARELAYKSTKRTLFVDARIGVFHDVELYATVPVVLSYSWGHTFASGVDRTNSTIHPVADSNAIMASDYTSSNRGGLGDVSFGLKFSPYNYYRDTAHPTWTLGLEYTAPTGTAMAIDNTGVGLGLHEIHTFFTISRRTLKVLEPWFNMHARLRVPSDSGLFIDKGPTQRNISPGTLVGTSFGTEIIPWEDLKQDARVELEFGFQIDYTFRGREYSEVWEALASPDNPCSAEDGCYNTLHYKSDIDKSTGQHTKTDGVTDVEQYGTFTGWASLHYQPIKHFQVSAKAQYAVQSPHFISFGDYGVDLDNKGGVQQANTATPPQNEYSPTFLPSLDAPGTRLRVQDVATWTIMIAMSGKL